MIKVEKIDVWGFAHAIRGMRNPMNSWSKSDSHPCDWQLSPDCNICGKLAADNTGECLEEFQQFYIVGNNDLKLMQNLFKAGTEHRKYLRQIFVSMDITAPIYWWKEFDTYKIGTTANSCSTMHKLTSRELKLDDFSIDDIRLEDDEISLMDCFINVVSDCEMYRRKCLEYRQKAKLQPDSAKHFNSIAQKYWKALIQLLPESYNQKRTVSMNYENVFNMIYQRTGHKLTEWISFVEYLKDLPYIREIGGIEGQ